MQSFEHFCTRIGLRWGGGVGIGGGVMLNVTRILFIVDIALLLVNTVLSAVNSGNLFPRDAWISFGENAALLLFFNLGVLFFLARMGASIRKGTFYGKKYTRAPPGSPGLTLFPIHVIKRYKYTCPTARKETE